MLVSLMSRLNGSIQVPCLLLLLLLSATVAFGQAQSNAADLQGTVRDSTGAVVANAAVTARNPGTNFSRSATTNDEGFYRIINVPPGDYEVTVEAPNFKKALLPKVTVTVGQAAALDVTLEPGQISESVTISDTTSAIVEPEKTAVSTTIDQQRINNLPINERNYLAFALTTSTVGRDNGRPIGPAPTTGLNFGGQRGRSNLVQVDGADNTDNSVNASRSTVSQEAVQEFQVVTNSFAAEFGRSAGGVVNVVTKSGTNELHGNVFGFLRHRSFQARNAFAPIEDPPFTRAQYGLTLGGPLDKGRTFFFFAFEQRRRNESGFFTSDVQGNLTSSVTILGQTFRNISPQQATYINQLLSAGATALAVPYAFLASSGGSTALTGTNPLVIFPGLTGALTPLPAGATVGPRFLLSSAPVPSGTTNAAGQFIAFRPLNNLQRIFPVTERTTFNSFRLDHLITPSHQFSFRFGYNPSEITGIQVESQNQSLGQNDFSRTGIQTLKDSSAVATLTSTLSNTIVNEARFNFGERRATFKSQNGDAVAFNISGTAFIGRELFSPVLRTETRYEFTDNVNVVAGSHNFKFGGDIAFVRIPEAIFELNFAGLFNFGGLGACTLLSAACATPGLPLPPDFTPVQQYGLGFPANFIEGFGNPVSSIGNKPMAFFAQDSWKIRRNLTLNYGVRYDYELTDQVPTLPLRDPLSGITLTADQVLAAQDAMGVQQGFPRDKNNWAPRLAIAWDPWGDGKTSIRGAFGLFYDHPLLAIAFNSDIADAVQQQQGILTPGLPTQTALLNAVQVFQGTVCPPGGPVTPICPAGVVTPGVAAGAQYQFGRQRFNDQTFPGFGPVLPFTLHVQKNFEYAYANQGNFTVERELTKDMTLSGSYIFVGAHHLPHPLDINAPRTDLQIQNFVRLAGRNPVSTTEAIAFSIPSASTPAIPFFPCPGGVPLQCFNLTTPAGAPAFPNAGRTFAVIVPGMITAPITNLGSRIVNAAVANFFRPSAPNYFLAQALSGGLVTPAVLNGALAGSLRTPGTISPFGSINAQTSDGNSTYHALNVDVKKRFSNHFQFLASYTWSHSIDDSSDLQTLLLPQDNRNFGAERADSLFDQRHRFVFSGVIASPSDWAKAGGFHRALSNFTLAPIFEISSGRPFNILSNQDTNNDQSNQTDRPSVLDDGTLCVPGTVGCAPLITNGVFTSGSLARNFGLTHRYISLDLRVAKLVPIGERVRLELIAEGFNLFNRFNEAAASPFIDDVRAFNLRAANGRYYSRPTAAFDPRQFQFGLKLNF